MNNSNLISKLDVHLSSTILLNTTIINAVHADTEERNRVEGQRKGLADWSSLLFTTDDCGDNDNKPYKTFLIRQCYFEGKSITNSKLRSVMVAIYASCNFRTSWD